MVKDPAKLPASASPVLNEEATMADRIKLGVIFAVNLANTRHMMDLTDSKKGQTQMALLRTADLIMEMYAIDSMVGRTIQIIKDQGEAKARIPILLCRGAMADYLNRIRTIGRDVMMNCSEDKDLDKNLKTFDLLVKPHAWKTHDVREALAAHFIEREQYALE